MQVRRARVQQWTPRAERRFLSALAATCSVKAACAEVGLWPGSAYNHRRRWQRFAEAWDAVLDTACARLEAELVMAGCNLLSDPGLAATGDDVAISTMTASQAVHLLHMHKHRLHGLGGRPGRQLSSNDELEQARARLEKIMRALGMLPKDA